MLKFYFNTSFLQKELLLHYRWNDWTEPENYTPYVGSSFIKTIRFVAGK